MNFIVHCLFPCLIIDKTIGSEVLRQPAVVGWGIGVGFGGVVCGMAVAALVARLLGLGVGSGRRTFSLAAGVQNYGYIAIPVLAVLFMQDGRDDEVLGMLFVHSLGVEVAFWGIGLMVLAGSLKGSLKYLLNGPIVAVAVGLCLAYSGAWRWLDPDSGPLLGQVLRQGMSWLGACAFPIALVLIGATTFDLLGKERPSFKIGAGAFLVRTVIMPVVLLCAARWLPIVVELRQVLLVQAAMPAAVSPILVARLYGGKPEVAVQVFLVTAIVGLFSMPLIVAWGLSFLGLQ